MNENEMLQMILNEIKGINGQIQGINGRLDRLEEGQKALRADVEDLKDGQKFLREEIGVVRRDVARVDRKLDKQGNDIADALWYLSNNVDQELNKLKQAK